MRVDISHDQRLARLEFRNRLLSAALILLIAVGVGVAAVPKKPLDHLELVSPDGRYKISLRADNHTAGIWVSGEPSGSLATIYSAAGQRSVIGVYGSDPNRGKLQGLDAAILADSDGGRLQLRSLCQGATSFDADRLAKISPNPP